MNDEVNPLYENRLLVFLEDIDKGIFYKVELDAAQFKKVSDAVIREKWQDPDLRQGFEMTSMQMKEDWTIPADTFIGLTSIEEEDSLNSPHT